MYFRRLIHHLIHGQRQKIADVAALKKIEGEVEAEMQAAVEFAIAAPYPEKSEVDQDIYA